MAAISNNKFEVYEWIKKVIDSCETGIQIVKTNKLIISFDNLYNDWYLKQCLYDYKDIKWRVIIERAKNYLNIDMLFDNFLSNSELNPDVIWDRDKFVNMLLIDDEFYQKWGENCCVTLSDEERYLEWFHNNYQTGMEFNSGVTPDYENDYYEPTPKRKLK